MSKRAAGDGAARSWIAVLLGVLALALLPFGTALVGLPELFGKLALLLSLTLPIVGIAACLVSRARDRMRSFALVLNALAACIVWGLLLYSTLIHPPS